jgi:protein arginine kinase activator
MKCESCRERDAVVHLTQIVSDTVSQLHLCDVCAAERGVEAPTAMKSPLGSFLAAMGKGGVEESTLPARADACPDCDATLRDFREIGRLGCPSCYTTFAVPLRELLRRLHGATTHVGERYIGPGETELAQVAAREQLREALAAAVVAEQFERAAELRDRLRSMP